ncbi:sulfotransferase [Candidatus Pelagibacter sp.]|nr:sulfotransferase [Candidatus Pelagibacter sp.]
MNKDLIEIDKLYRSNKFDEVINKTKSLIKKGKTLSPYYNLLGISLDNIGQTEESENNFKEAIKINSREISHYSNLAMILMKQSKLNEAEEILQKGSEIKKDDIHLIYEYGKLKRHRKEFLLSNRYFEKVYNINQNFSDTLLFIGKNYIDLALETGDKNYYNLAEKKLLESSKKFPDNVDADYILSERYNYAKDNKHQKIMLSKIENIKFNNSKQKSVIYFALAKSFEDQKKYSQCAEFLKIANNEINSTIDKDPILNFNRKFNNLKYMFENLINVKYLNDNDLYQRKIIFIVGMPRSGTTLVHQLLASAKEVDGIGESTVMPVFFDSVIFNKDFFSKVNLNNKLNKKYLIDISNTLGKNFDIVAKTKKTTLVDKNPSNFFWIGFIKLLFPHSKIIHTTRNLSDIGFSVYKNLFGVTEMDWSYSQKNIVEYINIYLKTIKFWKNNYGNSIYNLSYESLIQNKTEETKKLFSFCDLEWTEEIFDFYKTGKTIRTASVNQVKKPIYSSAVKSSNNFLNSLDFLKELDKISLK